MYETNIIQSFIEFTSSLDKTPSLMNLCDVLQKVDTPYRRCISEAEVDNAIDSLKDIKHSEISKSNGYANERQKDANKNLISLMAEISKKCVKDFLLKRELLISNG